MVDIDIPQAVITVGGEADLLTSGHTVNQMTWVHSAERAAQFDCVLVQCSAHGTPLPASLTISTDGRTAQWDWSTPQRRIAPGQSVVFYDPTDRFVLGGGICS